MEIKKSFNELRKPKIWLHYALGTLLVYFILKVIFNSLIADYLGTKELIIFYLIYVFSDRIIHGVLKI
jgi:hypothetical protein